MPNHNPRMHTYMILFVIDSSLRMFWHFWHIQWSQDYYTPLLNNPILCRQGFTKTSVLQGSLNSTGMEVFIWKQDDNFISDLLFFYDEKIFKFFLFFLSDKKEIVGMAGGKTQTWWFQGRPKRKNSMFE